MQQKNERELYQEQKDEECKNCQKNMTYILSQKLDGKDLFFCDTVEVILTKENCKWIK